MDKKQFPSNPQKGQPITKQPQQPQQQPNRAPNAPQQKKPGSNW
jgi:hypothetical protein